jgi:hypothetical protein
MKGLRRLGSRKNRSKEVSRVSHVFLIIYLGMAPEILHSKGKQAVLLQE